MKRVTPQRAIEIVQSAINLSEDAAAEWLISRAAQGLLQATARSEEWLRPTLSLEGEQEAFENYLELAGGYAPAAYAEFALDLQQDDIPVTWEHITHLEVLIPSLFWSWRQADEELWKHGSFHGRHEELSEFKYGLLGIEFDREQLEELLKPFRSQPGASDDKIVRLVVSNKDLEHSVSEITAAPPSERKRGHPGYEKDDRPLIAEMKILLESGEVRSVIEAAKRVVDKAAGDSVRESKVDRLRNRFRELEKNGEI